MRLMCGSDVPRSLLAGVSSSGVLSSLFAPAVRNIVKGMDWK